MEDYNGFKYLGGDEMLAGYEIGWEYPIGYMAPEQSAPTEDLALLFPEHFEAITTFFPDPNRPNPPRK
jgi:hypothetical protein